MGELELGLRMKFNDEPIDAPNSARLSALCLQLKSLSAESDSTIAWPAKQLELIAEAGIYHWFVPELLGGSGCLLYTSPSPRDATLARMPSSA